MGGSFWIVVGGGDKGGIIVRKEKDTASDLLPERLTTGSVVEELDLEGERLQYRRLEGGGPTTGWVSKSTPDKDLLVRSDKIWEVVAVNDKGGIVVREGLATDSPLLPVRLSTGAFLLELELQGIRLHYRRITGTGPDEGWVSLKLNDGKPLVGALSERLAPLPPSGPPLIAEPSKDRWANWNERMQGAPQWWEELPQGDETTGFTYEGLPLWVPTVAAVTRLWREKLPFMPPPDTGLARIEKAGPLLPFKKFKPKELAANSKENLPGCMFGLTFPKTSAEMASAEFGAEFLTKAFHAAGTLPEDNSVAKLTRVQELPVKGFDAAGGAAMKMFLTVEYAKPDPELHTELFVKYPYLYEEYPSSRSEVSGYNDVDGPEVNASLRLIHLFPFRTAKFYFGDVCRETTNWILITETIPFGRRGKVENGKIVEKIEYKPYDLLPVCGKYQDWLLPDPAEFYCCLFRCMGRLAAWDKLGRFTFFLGEPPTYTPEAYLGFSPKAQQPKAVMDNVKKTVEKMIEKGIVFLTKTIKKVTPPRLQNLAQLNKLKEDMVEMAPYFTDISQYYQVNDTDFIAAIHANLQADNAFFWRNEHGDLSNGVLDWGGFGRGPFCSSFLGCLSGAEAALLYEHEEGILQHFVDEYARGGGPVLNIKEVQLRFRLAYITFIYDSTQWIERDIMKLTTQDKLESFTGIMDPEFQDLFRVRCRATSIINSFEYFITRNDFKATFDAFASSHGKPYLTVYG